MPKNMGQLKQKESLLMAQGKLALWIKADIDLLMLGEKNIIYLSETVSLTSLREPNQKTLELNR